jgi:hypothetical protein
LTYINVHSANNGAGEIRGIVPEPSTAWMLLVGLGVVAKMRRRSALN